ncbi:ethylmalonyl-CoA decarboxylase-like isoform X2 [Adelges cooleyi]|uniref:ethylmalonyl-CoA decarboxylase-like isoform X2 n=1 Tax=Adelges cooleyi TaxID=133065 RepID=UPI002180321C|nr:ethylmalonyl-CoA decarboxylase-like isoform X2 [Adelges cooleyi]XP_050438837.1 ethylmalonyl-CoA decarboxylase-like isoform X2 [Adelges cooleyi]
MSTRFTSSTSKMASNPVRNCPCLLYAGPEPSIDEARATMSTFFGGSVDLEKDEVNCIAKIKLNYTQIKNAISGKMMVDLEGIVDELEQWGKCKGALLHGADGNFCSGGDLNMARKANNPESGYAMSTYMHAILNRFQMLPFITVAYIDGIGALGGGAELSTACDYRLMCDDRTTVIGFVHGRMGLVPAWGATGRLLAIVGRQKATDLLLDAKPVPAEYALRIGLADDTVATLSDAVNWLLRKVGRNHVDVIKAIKYTRSTYDKHCKWQECAGQMERKIFAPLWGGSANREALSKNIKHNTS